jgi:hypothetical protein
VRIPPWPSFNADSTSKGVTDWVAVTAWFYVTPVRLILVGRINKRRSASQLKAVRSFTTNPGHSRVGMSANAHYRLPAPGSVPLWVAYANPAGP